FSFLSPVFLYFSFCLPLPPPTSTLFPYTTLFRSASNFLFFIVLSLLSYNFFFSLFSFLSSESSLISPKLKKQEVQRDLPADVSQDRKSTRLNSSHVSISYAVFCLKKKKVRAIYIA